MKIKIILNITLKSCLLLCVNSLYAQDVHFSNIEYAPMNLNPALVGVHAPFQAIVNYRTQWNSVGDPFKTFGASVDGQLNANNSRRNGIFAAGLNFINDKSGSLVSSNSANLSLAYHLMASRYTTLGIAIYGGYNQKTVNQPDGRWGKQYNGTSYDATIISGESFTNTSINALDAGTGFVYSFKNDRDNRRNIFKRELTTGVSVFHVNRPNDSFLGNTSKLPMRFTFFANALIDVTGGSILPAIYYQRQATANELMLGAFYKVELSQGARITGYTTGSSFSFGLFSRIKDAMILKLMYEYEQFSAGVSYDINVSSLRKASHYNGGFEFMLRYSLNDISLWKNRY
jgi:type IX secretion system PorP/SprF family membrane protein